MRAAVVGAAEQLGGLDILVNNAGIGAHGTVEANPDDEWHRVLDVNVVGIVRVTRAALPHLRASHAAAIVNTCSIAATAGLPQPGALQRQQGRGAVADPGHGRRPRAPRASGSTASTPAPSTPRGCAGCSAAAADPAAELAALRGPPAHRPAGQPPTRSPRRIAYLASPLAGATTGTVLAVDGGMHGLRLPTPPSP